MKESRQYSSLGKTGWRSIAGAYLRYHFRRRETTRERTLRVVEKLLQVDPSGAMAAIGEMTRKKITMPAYLMYDGEDPKLFVHFSAVAHVVGVYTAIDYADIVEFLTGRWRLEKLQHLTSEGQHAQEFVCGLPARIRKFQERADEKAKKMKPDGACKFSQYHRSDSKWLVAW